MPRVAHRQHPDRARETRERVWSIVERKLAGRVICARCRATFATHDDICMAALNERCPGITTIEAARLDALREVAPTC